MASLEDKINIVVAKAVVNVVAQVVQILQEEKLNAAEDQSKIVVKFVKMIQTQFV